MNRSQIRSGYAGQSAHAEDNLLRLHEADALRHPPRESADINIHIASLESPLELLDLWPLSAARDEPGEDVR